MRKIKFRGRGCMGTYKGVWAYGELSEEMYRHKGYSIIWEIEKYGHGIPVDPETVGQLVGIQDADGRDIYEGDILQSIPEEEYIPKLTNGRFHSEKEAWEADFNTLSEEEKITVEAIFKVQWRYNTKAVVIYNDFTYDLVETGNPLLARHFFLCRPEFWRIVGNIHDNPELLTSK